MRIAIGANETSSATNPVLDIWLQMATTVDCDNTGTVQTILTNPEALSFVVFAEQKDGSLVEIYSHTCDLVNDQIQSRLTGIPELGHYAAAFAPSGASPVPPPGTKCQINWAWTMPNGATGIMVREFDVLSNVPPQREHAGSYCLVSDLREEGFPPERASDQRLLRLIAMQSRYIDRVTGRFFEPRFVTQTLNGTGGRAMQLGDPIIALSLVTLGNPSVNTIEPESFRVFNRHISAGLTNPDDRNDPKIEFVHYRDIFGRQRSASIDSPLFGVPFRDLFFPSGVQNVNITGLFGFTDPDGSSSGMTPELIRHACKLLVYRELFKLSSDERDERKRHRILSEGTRDQRYTMAAAQEGAFTGDREIDDILLTFMRPMMIGAV